MFTDDEAQHFKQMSREASERLELATEGLGICSSFVGLSIDGKHLSDRLVVLGLLGHKAIDHLRGVQLSLVSGHYQSVPILLRASMTTVGVLARASADGNYLRRWMFVTSADRTEFPDRNGRFQKFDQMSRALERTALEQYDALLPDTADKQGPSDLVRSFCQHSHPSLTGLVDALQIGAENPRELSHMLLREFFGKGAVGAVEAANGNPYEALRRLPKRRKRRRRGSPSQPSNAEQREVGDDGLSIEVGFSSPRPDLLDYYSRLTLNTAHHLFDVLFEHLPPLAEREAQVLADQWHASSEALMEAE